MFLRELSIPVDHVRGAGPSTVRALAKGGITQVGHLLSYYPRSWEDRSRYVPLRDFARYPAVCTTVTILAHTWFGAGTMRTLKVYVEDETERAALICFNRPFLEKQLPVGERFRLWGRFYFKYGEIQSTAFEVEALQGESEGELKTGNPSRSFTSTFGALLPVYPLTGGLTQGVLRRLIKQALLQYAAPLEDELPEPIRRSQSLLSKAQAIRAIHFPSDQTELDKARETLIFEELFYLEVLVALRSLGRRKSRRKGFPGEASPSAGQLTPLQQRFAERLPFRLTEGQKSAIGDINKAMAGDLPMARLLQGDVGSGKTLVAFFAALRALELGGQTAILAPTELLARQHAENAARLLEPLGIRPAFLTGNIKASGRGQLLRALAQGDVDLVVGTHALFSSDVAYRNLRLVVIDEQHRFGVVQRSAIMAKGDLPDLLMMSATPIPRTLALTVFGDLDVSVIRDMPEGRKPVITHLAKQSNEEKVYDFVRRQLEKGRQAYFVYPLIEGGDDQGTGETTLKDAQSMAHRLATELFPTFPVALIHSKLEEEEKKSAMEAFRTGVVRILVATTVVEVGVDVPNATCMVVEHAERFGLSALHQLRGRVGRGKDQAYCFLVYSDQLTEDGKARLKVMLESHDGFVIAEEDLKIRGPGRIAGIEQSGYLGLGISDPLRDVDQLVRARTEAFAILEKDPELGEPEHRVIAQVLERAPPFAQVGL